MASARLFIAWLALASAAGCGGSPPPRELDGFWSAGAASCAAGVGVRFGPNAIETVYEDERQTLFAHPRYQVLSGGEALRVRIRYDLPRLPGGARSVGAHGVLVLARRPGGIALESHNLVDPRTGAVRMRIGDDPARTALTLTRCGQNAWREDLRGRRER